MGPTTYGFNGPASGHLRLEEDFISGGTSLHTLRRPGRPNHPSKKGESSSCARHHASPTAGSRFSEDQSGYLPRTRDTARRGET